MAVPPDWQFGILGPLTVKDGGGGESDLGGSRQRALLALLLLRRSEAVSADRLVDDLWGGSPPAGATKTLQVYVSRLRAALGEGLVVRRGPGYALEIDASRLDADRFERLLDEGRRQLADGDPRAALATLDEALGLWRGPALSEFEYESWAQPERRRLEELRLLALEERVEARLALGESDRLVPELQALVAAHPLRERLRAQAMYALYRAGRQADALTLFRDGRRRLVEELGVEPGPELQELQRQILAHAPELGRVARPRPLVGARSARRLILVGALLLAGAVAAAAVELTSGGASAVGATAVASLDPGSGRLRAQVVLPSPATDIAVGGGSVWALSGDTGTITELDARGGRLLATFAAGVRAVDVAYGGGRLWLLASGTGAPHAAPATVTEIDPHSRAIVDTIPLPEVPQTAPFFYGHLPGAHLLAWAAGSLWTIGPDGSVYRIDPTRGRIVATIPNLSGQGIAASGKVVWVRLDQSGPTTFEQIDPATDRAGKPLRTPAIGLNAPASFALGAGALWLPDTYAGLLYRITPGGHLPVVRAAQIGVGVTSIAFAGGSVWAGDEVHDTLTRVDPTADRVLRVVRVPSPQSLAATPTGVWVGSGPAPAATLPQSNCAALVYGGPGRPRFLIASDLALQGFASTVNLAMARAVEWTLRRDGFRAGPYTVGYQSCDDSTPQAGTFDFAKCVANAQLFAKTPRVLGVVGTYNSPCTGEELPLLNQAPHGAVPIVSPQNTFQILTRGSPAAPPGVLKHFYPTGVRNFLRVTPIDTHEIAADAILAHQLGLHRVLVVADDSTGGSAIHTPEFESAARKLAIHTRVYLWHIEQQPARVVVAAAQRFHADGVFIAAGYPPRLAQLIRALRTTLGSRYPIIGTDYFQAGNGIWQTAGGPIAAGVYVSNFGLPNAQLPPAGQRFLHAFGPTTPSWGAAYAAQATEVLLDAISHSDGTRTSVLHQLYATRIGDGIVGPIRFDRNGDVVNGPITILRLQAGDHATADPTFANTVVDRILTPPTSIVP